MAEAPKFEESLRQLEELVEQLEAGDLDLDVALKKFEQGVKVAAALNKTLEEASQRVEKLSVPRGDDDGDEGGEDEAKAPKASPAKKTKKGKAGQDSLFE